ncbi:hypothetical protein vseg_002814 [Gypsophila vaccaria]
MKGSRKGRKVEEKKIVSSHLITLHQRLYQTLHSGFRYSENKEKEWYTNDAEMQRLVIRSMSAFLADISPETVHTPLVKDSVADMVKAIRSILLSPYDNLLTMASELVVRLINVLPYSLLQPHVGHLSYPLTFLLSCRQSQVVIMSTTALNLILSNLNRKKDNDMWQILAKQSVVSQVICNMKTYLSNKIIPIEYFVETASLLSSVMQIRPHTRYLVWTDYKLREVVDLLCRRPETSVRVGVLQLYSAIALCGFGAQKIMESGELLMNTIVHYMGKQQPQPHRVIAFRAAQRMMACEDLCSKALSFSCKPLMESIISAMNFSRTHNGKVSNEDVCLMMEACRLTLITRWPGRHHGYLWKLGVLKSLVNILMYDLPYVHQHHQSSSAEELISVVREALNANFLPNLRCFVWEIIGSLSAHCEEDFNPNKNGNEFYIRVLIASACLSFMDSMGREHRLRRADREYTLHSVSAAKAVLMMMYSPCEYIAFHTKLILSEVLREGGERLKHMLKDFHFLDPEGTSMPDELQTLISLIGLACYSGLPDFCRYVVRNEGATTLLAFVRWWLHNEDHIDFVSLSSHLKDSVNVQVCCRMDMDDWEGREIHLLLALWSLAELIKSHEAKGLPVDIFVGQTTYGKELFIHDMQNICFNASSSGLRWYSSYLLSLFGVYGFTTKLGKKVSSLLCERDYSDMYLALRDGQCISVHQVVLNIRCPSFLPPDDPVTKESPNRYLEDQVIDDIHKTKKEVTLSAHVDEQALQKVLEYVYSGCIHAGGELVRKVKVLAKHCNIQPLQHLLCNKRPKWATSVPSFDLTAALGPSGRNFSDVILEAKSKDDTGWTANCCSFSEPHIHCHKAILMSSSCDYVRGLFQSGMQESRSESLKVPVSWEALNKWVVWVYSGDLPKPVTGCLWNNMEAEKKMYELQAYIELCWLAEFWFIDDLQKECSEVVASFLDTPELSLKLIQFAANLSQWEIVNVAANNIAPIYLKLRISGELDLLDEGLVEIIRLASVRLSQE